MQEIGRGAHQSASRKAADTNERESGVQVLNEGIMDACSRAVKPSGIVQIVNV
jgi:hypothetical protein